MAYTSYEIIPAKVINHRVIPRLWKLKRSDGTFDLFCLSSLQHNCVNYLVSQGQAGVFAGRENSDSIRGFSEYSVSTEYSNFNALSVYCYDGTRYGSVPKCSFRLKLSNNANLFPWRIQGFNYSDKNAGTRWLRLYNGSEWVTKAGGAYSQGNWGGGSNSNRVVATLWEFDVSNLSTVFDYKDYSQLYVMFRAVDGSKFTGSAARLIVNFVHRYTDTHPLHRYYR